MENLVTNSNVVLNMVLRGARNLNLNVDELIKILPEGIEQASSEAKRFTTLHIPKVWQWFEANSQDPNIGFRLALETPISSQSVLSYLFMSSQTLGLAINKFIQYQDLIGDCCNLSLTITKNECHFTFDLGPDDIDVIRQENEYGTLLICNWLKFLLPEQWKITRVHFNHPQPDDISEHLALFDCEIVFDCERTYIVFDKSLLELPVKFYNPSMHELVEQQAKALLTQLQGIKLIQSIELEIDKNLADSNLSITNIAQQCQLSERQLQLQLAKHDTSFSQLLEQQKQKLAQTLLQSNQQSIAEISDACGFSEPSTFNRAFKRWYNLTPSQYRKNHQATLLHA